MVLVMNIQEEFHVYVGPNLRFVRVVVRFGVVFSVNVVHASLAVRFLLLFKAGVLLLGTSILRQPSICI